METIKARALARREARTKKGNKGDSKGKITFATWIRSGIGWVGTATTAGCGHRWKDCWRGNMEKDSHATD